MKVGTNYEIREVSELNHELFLKAKEIMEDSCINNSQRAWHIGWGCVGDYIDWLEENYNITPKQGK